MKTATAEILQQANANQNAAEYRPEHAIDLGMVESASDDERYVLPDNRAQWAQDVPNNVFDAEGQLTADKMAAAYARFQDLGALNIINTGLEAQEQNDVPMHVLECLGFGEKEQFKWGGLTSGRTNLKYISRCMRETDAYPEEKFLLPHNEILYQRFMPERLLFICSQPTKKGSGGRTFAHCALKTEAYIAGCGAAGSALLEKMRKGGFTIETGFLDDAHPEKSKNYFRSWQDRFGTADRDEAIAVCKQSTHQFDDCNWMAEDGIDAPTLMTRINIPAFKKDPRDGRDYMLFPRIALDGPKAHNGYRRFLIGDAELTKTETAILLQAFLATREGRYYNAGDILLVDNIRYGHSRESFEGARKIHASMAGMFWTDDAVQ
ncbi:MAG: hypothetical protein PW788_14575 [Micavibrio sp.]|nr:hypothetical protein [Micavibrio sp.]